MMLLGCASVRLAKFKWGQSSLFPSVLNYRISSPREFSSPLKVYDIGINWRRKHRNAYQVSIYPPSLNLLSGIRMTCRTVQSVVDRVHMRCVAPIWLQVDLCSCPKSVNGVK
jgi:hypothetical protein